jgi:hypothetical protein
MHEAQFEITKSLLPESAMQDTDFITTYNIYLKHYFQRGVHLKK